MNTLINFEGLAEEVINTAEVVKELDKLSNQLFNMDAVNFEMAKVKQDIWFKVCQVRNRIWFEDNIECTQSKLAELRDYIFSVRNSLV